MKTTTTSTALPMASFWARLVALGIDFMLIVFFASMFIGILYGRHSQYWQQVMVILIVASFYQVFFLVTTSTTLGKMALRLSVVDKQGFALQPDAAILRSLVDLVFVWIVSIGVVVSLIMVLRDPLRRSLHDRIAGTLVIRGRPREVDTLNRYQ